MKELEKKNRLELCSLCVQILAHLEDNEKVAINSYKNLHLHINDCLNAKSI